MPISSPKSPSTISALTPPHPRSAHGDVRLPIHSDPAPAPELLAPANAITSNPSFERYRRNGVARQCSAHGLVSIRAADPPVTRRSPSGHDLLLPSAEPSIRRASQDRGGNTARVYKFDVARLTAPRQEPTSLRGDGAISESTSRPTYNDRIRRPA